MANDGDGTAENVELRYSISDAAGKGFVVDQRTGELFVNTTIDFETKDSHKFNVRATNVGK